jgi:integrase
VFRHRALQVSGNSAALESFAGSARGGNYGVAGVLTISLGVYPDVGLADAREKREAARKMVAAGVDPAEHRKAAQVALQESIENTFAAIAREWFGVFSPKWVETHSCKVLGRLEADLIPWLGSRPIRDITAPEVLSALRRIGARGADETSRRALQDCGRVFRYAIATGRADRDPTRDLAGALVPRSVVHHPSITEPKAVGALMRAIDDYEGNFITRSALRLAPLVFTRPGELRGATWSEIDFDKAEWRIPAERMKMREKHVVPLSTQAVGILKDLHPRTGRFNFVFPSVQSRLRPISENTINSALRRLGYEKTEMTGHGFRSMASTLLNELGWNRDAIERQLAHGERNAVRAAYNYAEHLPERRRMMQAWSDFLDQLKADHNYVTPRTTLTT